MVLRADSRRQTQDSPRTRSDTRSIPHVASPPKPTPKKTQNHLPSNGQPHPKLPDPSHSPSVSSSDSDSDSDPESDSVEHVYLLHRRLDFRYLNQHSVHSGSDVFTSRKWNLSRDRLKAFAELKDTDLVQLHYPVPLIPPVSNKLTLANIAPPLNPAASTSKPPPTGLPSSSAPTFKPRLPKVCPDSLSGPSVSSLYYSPYSSFAPSYDSTGCSQTYDQARMAYLSKERIQSWVQRPNRYATVAPEPEPKPANETATLAEKEKPVGPTTRRRKRQKITASADPPAPAPPPKEPTPPPTKEDLQRSISDALGETSKLLMNLQERQFERLRAAQEAHLDPLLSAAAPVSSAPEPPGAGGGGVGPDWEEMSEAAELMKRLSKLIALRPRLDPAHLDSGTCMADPESDAHQQPLGSLVPCSGAIRRSYAMLTEPAEHCSSNAPYNGDLPAASPIGISETILTTEPNPRLLSIIERTLQAGPPSHGGAGSLAAFRDPALLGPRAQAAMGMGADKANGVNGLVSKLGHGHAGASYGASQAGLTSLQQQQQLQAQRILAGSPFKSRPSVTGTSLGGIASKVLGNAATVVGAGLNEHPNHRALAGKIGQQQQLPQTGVMKSNSSSSGTNNHQGRLGR